jgi:hypothetical protein
MLHIIILHVNHIAYITGILLLMGITYTPLYVYCIVDSRYCYLFPWTILWLCCVSLKLICFFDTIELFRKTLLECGFRIFCDNYYICINHQLSATLHIHKLNANTVLFPQDSYAQGGQPSFSNVALPCSSLCYSEETYDVNGHQNRLDQVFIFLRCTAFLLGWAAGVF